MLTKKRSKTERPRLLVLSGDISCNRGDRAIRRALVDLVREAYPGARILSSSRTPERDRQELDTVPVSRTEAGLLWRLPALRPIDLVIWGGGQRLQDDSSRVKNVYWAAMVSAVRALAGAPIVALGVGLGPFDTATGRWFGRQALRRVASVLARDRRSADWSARLAPAVPVSVAPDPAVFLRPASRDAALAHWHEAGIPWRKDELRVGVSLRRWFHLHRNLAPIAWRWRASGRPPSDVPAYRRFCENLATALNRLAAEQRVRLIFFPMHTAPWEADDVESRRLAERVDAPSHVLRLEGGPRRHKALCGLCDLFIGVRLHGALLALGMGVPTLGISYCEKGSDFFSEAGLDELHMPIERAAGEGGAEALVRRLRTLAQRRGALRKTLERRWAALEQQRPVYVETLRTMLR